MATAIDMSRLSQGVSLPPQLSSEIVTRARATNPFFQLAKPIAMPGPGVEVTILDGEPEAAWVEETGAKPVGKSTFKSKTIRPHKVAVIELVSAEFMRDAARLYSVLEERLPDALTRTIVKTIAGEVTAPAPDFTQLSSAKAVTIDTKNVLNTVLDIEDTIADADGTVSGYALNPRGKTALQRAVDGNGRPLLFDSVSNGNPTLSVMGANALVSADVKGPEGTLGYAGDWSFAQFGMVEAVQIKSTDQSSVVLPDGTVVHIWQRNMVAILAEVEVAFSADLAKFVRLVKAAA